jgi:hypothetical protein
VSRLLTPEWLHAAEDREVQDSEDAKLKANDGKIRQVLDFMKELIEDGNQALRGTGRIKHNDIAAYLSLLKSLYWSIAMASIDGSTKLGDTRKSRMKDLYTPLRGRVISEGSLHTVACTIELDDKVVGWKSKSGEEARYNNQYMYMNGMYIRNPENCLAAQEIDSQHHAPFESNKKLKGMLNLSNEQLQLYIGQLQRLSYRTGWRDRSNIQRVIGTRTPSGIRSDQFGFGIRSGCEVGRRTYFKPERATNGSPKSCCSIS